MKKFYPPSIRRAIFLFSFFLFVVLIGLDWRVEALPQEGASIPSEGLLKPIFRIRTGEGLENYQTFSHLKIDQSQVVAFRAIVSRRWPSGMVPVYLVKRAGTIRLQRFPPTGQEALVEPLFFGLPSASERTNRDLLGRWECIATHEDGAEDYFAWDLTLRGSDLVGRFDVDTDFRFASILGGHLLKNQIRFDVQYIEAKYRLEGILERGELKGDWWRVNENGKGTWKALRPEPTRRLPQEGLVHLWEYSQEGQPSIYRVEGQTVEASWIREDQPICLVWQDMTISHE